MRYVSSWFTGGAVAEVSDGSAEGTSESEGVEYAMGTPMGRVMSFDRVSSLTANADEALRLVEQERRMMHLSSSSDDLTEVLGGHESGSSGYSPPRLRRQFDPSAKRTILQLDVSDERLSSEWERRVQSSDSDVRRESADCSDAQKAVNGHKNRYTNVLPYNFNRVALRESARHFSSDYINASLVEGHDGYKYISTQAPTRNTVAEFWWMVWEQRSAVIIMLTQLFEKGKPKAEVYWPLSTDAVLDFHGLRVRMRASKGGSDKLRVTEYVLELDGAERSVMHLHYLGWGDFGAPKETADVVDLAAMLDEYERAAEFIAGPPVIHCSAGIGRTGTFIIVHMLHTMAERGDALSAVRVPDMVLRLRHFRKGMVQSHDQYRFIYRVLGDMLQRSSACLRLSSGEVQVITESLEQSHISPHNSPVVVLGNLSLTDAIPAAPTTDLKNLDIDDTDHFPITESLFISDHERGSQRALLRSSAPGELMSLFPSSSRKRRAPLEDERISF